MPNTSGGETRVLIKWLPICFMAAAILFGIADTAYFYPRLPPRIASHFDAQGRPNGWSTKSEFVGFGAAMIAIVVVMFAAVSYVIRIAPVDLINLPKKKYWMALEREAETRQYLTSWGLSLAAVTLWLLVMIWHEAMSANLQQPPQMESVWYMMGGFFGVVVTLVVQLILRFSRKLRAA